MPNERSHLLRADEIDRLRKQRGLSKDALARKANVHVKTLRRWLNGNPAFMENVALLAQALQTTTENLIASPLNGQLNHGEIGVRLSLHVLGKLAATESSGIVERLSEGIRQLLIECGVQPEAVSAKIDLLKPPDGEKTRTIMFMWAKFANGTPAWVFVAVRPSRLQLFHTAHKAEVLDLYDFSPYGEIIVSGHELEGMLPPLSIARTVAHMYEVNEPEGFIQKIIECPWDDS